MEENAIVVVPEATAPVEKQKKVVTENVYSGPKLIKVSIQSGVRRGLILIKHGIEYRYIPAEQVPDVSKNQFEISELEYQKLAKAKWGK